MLVLGLALGAVGALIWHGSNGAPIAPASPAAKAPPATGAVIREAQLNLVALSPEARESLGIRTEPARTESVRRERVYGGELLVPSGQSIVVHAPVAGTLTGGTAPLRAGTAVESGKVLFHVTPTYSVEGKTALTVSGMEASGQVRSARTQVEVSRVALERAERMAKGEAGSRRAVEEAQGQLRVAESLLDAALAREATLATALQDIAAGHLPTIPITAPISGTVRVVSTTGGQLVPAGSALLEIVDFRGLWVRVAVPTADLSAIDRNADATVIDSFASMGTTVRATRVVAPPSATSAAGTVDLYYELAPEDEQRSPGERVSVSLALEGPESGLTVPWSSLVYDVHGTTWLYVERDATTYERQRAILRRVSADRALLAVGPAPGTPVVAAGAAELFGFETGFAK